jgi:hypothetical protein
MGGGRLEGVRQIVSGVAADPPLPRLGDLQDLARLQARPAGAEFGGCLQDGPTGDSLVARARGRWSGVACLLRGAGRFHGPHEALAIQVRLTVWPRIGGTMSGENLLKFSQSA